MRTVSSAIAFCACSVEAPTWCVPMTAGRRAIPSSKVPVPPAGSFAKTSRPARSPFSAMAASRAGWSTTSPRLVFTKKAPGFLASKHFAAARALRLLRGRAVHGHDAGRGRERVDRGGARDAESGRAVVVQRAAPGDDRHPEGLRARDDLEADRPEADDAERAAREAASLPV